MIKGAFQLCPWKVNSIHLSPLNITDVIANIIAKEKLIYVYELIIPCIHLRSFFNPHIQSLFTTLLCFVYHSRKCFQHMLISSQVTGFVFYFSSSVLQKKYQRNVFIKTRQTVGDVANLVWKQVFSVIYYCRYKIVQLK